jgi:protocatechuate 3,4-dioxygenase beta subunit
MTISHPCKIKAGKMTLASREVFEEGVMAMADGEDYEITVGKKKKRRTRGREGELGNQDGAFFGPIMEVVAKEIWQTKDMKEAYYRTLEAVSFKLVGNPKGGPPLKVLIHVSDLDCAGMARLIDDTLIWAAQEHGVYIPEPDAKKSKAWRERFQREYQYVGVD